MGCPKAHAVRSGRVSRITLHQYFCLPSSHPRWSTTPKDRSTQAHRPATPSQRLQLLHVSGCSSRKGQQGPPHPHPKAHGSHSPAQPHTLPGAGPRHTRSLGTEVSPPRVQWRARQGHTQAKQLPSQSTYPEWRGRQRGRATWMCSLCLKFQIIPTRLQLQVLRVSCSGFLRLSEVGGVSAAGLPMNTLTHTHSLPHCLCLELALSPSHSLCFTQACRKPVG